MIVTRGCSPDSTRSRRAADVEAFLVSAQALALRGAATPAWFALKLRPQRVRHLRRLRRRGRPRRAPVRADRAGADGQRRTLLPKPPTIEKIDCWRAGCRTDGPPAEAKKALLLTFQPKQGRSAEVESFLLGAEAMVATEPARSPGSRSAWPTAATASSMSSPTTPAASRTSRVRCARELAKHALSLLGSFPDIGMIDVLAEKR